MATSPMAQSVARQAVNLQVAGSNPAGGEILSRAATLRRRMHNKKAPAVGIEPTTSGSGNRRASIAPRGHWRGNNGGSWSCWGSNPGPSPYQSDALPTELHDRWLPLLSVAWLNGRALDLGSNGCRFESCRDRFAAVMMCTSWPLSSVAEHRSRKPGVESSILSVAFSSQ